MFSSRTMRLSSESHSPPPQKYVSASVEFEVGTGVGVKEIVVVNVCGGSSAQGSHFVGVRAGHGSKTVKLDGRHSGQGSQVLGGGEQMALSIMAAAKVPIVPITAKGTWSIAFAGRAKFCVGHRGRPLTFSSCEFGSHLVDGELLSFLSQTELKKNMIWPFPVSA